jgi:serine protease Do
MQDTMLTRTVRSFFAAIVVAAALPASAAAADPFNELAEATNKKLVKLFGAGGFSRLNNFGTGIIISKDGYVLTVASQLLDTSDLVVHLYDGQRMKAQVVVVEPELDAAIVKIRAEGRKLEDPLGFDLNYFDIAEAAKRPPATVGDWALALSNTFEIALRDEPLSLQRGVIMAHTKLAGRRGVFEFPYTGDVYVTDMIMNNPGAAGGALIDRKGNLLGVIGREIKNSLSDTWMNYAIPVTAKAEVKIRELVKDKDGKEKEEERTVSVSMTEFAVKGMKGEYKPILGKTTIKGEGGYIGIIFVPDILERTPAYVEDVVPGSPAAKAGIRPDDLVSFVDGEPVVSIKGFREWLQKNTRPGQQIRIEVRRGESLQTVEVMLAPHPAKPGPPMPSPPPVSKTP